MPNYSYRCPFGHETDAVRPISTDAIPCSCGREAVRVSVYQMSLVTPELKFHGRDFFEASEMLESKRAEYEKREGMPVQLPNFMKAAQQRAASLRQAGATARDI